MVSNIEVKTMLKLQYEHLGRVISLDSQTLGDAELNAISSVYLALDKAIISLGE
jgi:hypothetical protein